MESQTYRNLESSKIDISTWEHFIKNLNAFVKQINLSWSKEKYFLLI